MFLGASKSRFGRLIFAVMRGVIQAERAKEFEVFLFGVLTLSSSTQSPLVNCPPTKEVDAKIALFQQVLFRT